MRYRELKKNHDALQAEHDKLSILYNELKQKLEQGQNENDVKKHQRKPSELLSIKEWEKESFKSISPLVSEDLTKRMNELKSSNSGLETENNLLTEKLKLQQVEQEQKLKSAEEKLKKLRLENERLTTDLDESETLRQILEQNQRDSEVKLDEYDNHLSKNKRTIQDQNSQVTNELTQITQTHSELSNKHMQLLQTHSELSNKHSELLETHAKTSASLESLHQKHEELEGKYQEAIEHHASLVTQRTILTEDKATKISPGPEEVIVNSDVCEVADDTATSSPVSRARAAELAMLAQAQTLNHLAQENKRLNQELTHGPLEEHCHAREEAAQAQKEVGGLILELAHKDEEVRQLKAENSRLAALKQQAERINTAFARELSDIRQARQDLEAKLTGQFGGLQLITSRVDSNSPKQQIKKRSKNLKKSSTSSSSTKKQSPRRSSSPRRTSNKNTQLPSSSDAPATSRTKICPSPALPPNGPDDAQTHSLERDALALEPDATQPHDSNLNGKAWARVLQKIPADLSKEHTKCRRALFQV